MLVWEATNTDDSGVVWRAQARIMATAVDGTPIEMFRVVATTEGYDIQDRNIGPKDHSGHVLARAFDCKDLEDAQRKAEIALREIFFRLLGNCI